MASGSNNLTTYYAKRIIGDINAQSSATALLQTGTGITTDMWILGHTLHSDYGIHYNYDSSNSSDDKLELCGGSSTPTAWVQLNNGNTYILGQVGINYNPNTANNPYQVYVNGDVRMDGCLHIFPIDDGYIAGIRIHSYNNWSTILLCGPDNTGDTATSTKSWLIGNDNGTFYITHNGSDSSTTGYLIASTENSKGYWQFYDRVGINGIDSTQNFYVNGITYFNGNVTHNGIVYFANGTTYYINNSANGHLNTLALASDLTFDATSSTGTSGKISWSGSGDGADIYYSVPVAEQGNLVINTRDDTNCLVAFAYNDTITAYMNNSTPCFYPAVNNVGNIGTKDNEWATTYTRQIYVRHIDASKNITTDQNIYYGYNYATNHYFYTNDGSANNTTRTHRATINATGLYINQIDTQRNAGIIGKYNANKAALIWSMGSSYNIAADGSGLGTLYGAAYGYGGKDYLDSKAYAGGHQFIWCNNGAPQVALGSNGIWIKKAGGIYWDPYVESASDASDATSIYQIVSGVAGGTELRISQQNDTTDVINLCAPSYIYFNSKKAFTISDTWLRINEDKGFSSGIYTGTSLIRTDNQLQVGNAGANFYANSSGNGYFSNTLGIAGTNTSYNFYVNGTSYFNNTITSTGNIYISNTSPHIYLQNTNWTKGTTPASNYYSALEFHTSGDYASNKRVGILEVNIDTSNNVWMNIWTIPNVSGSTSWTGIRLKRASDGTLTIYNAGSTEVTGTVTASSHIHANGGYLKSTLNSNTVSIGSQNNGFCHITNSANIPFWFNKSIYMEQGTTIGAAGTQYRPFQLYLGRYSTTAGNALNTANPLIEFSNSDRSQYCQLMYDDHDSLVAPDSLTLVGNQNGIFFICKNGPIWVQGGSNAGGNQNRLTTSAGMPGNMQYNTSRRGTQIYANGIAFADPYNGNSNNDAGWIRHQETTGNSGELEIAVGDDGNETIVVRQYQTDNTVKRTLTLLSKDGYTLIPSYLNIGGHEKNASSPTYVWGSNSSDNYLRSYQTSKLSVATSASCTGNAATATTLKTARSLWGNSFNGSADISGSIYLGAGNDLYMKYNSTNYDVVSNYNNGNVVITACSGGLYIGYINTTLINFINGKASLNSSGYLTTADSIQVSRSAYTDGGSYIRITSNSKTVGLHVGSGGTNRGLYDWTKNDWIVYCNSSNVSTLNGNCTGSAGSVAWENTGHPSTFPPSAHAHTVGDIVWKNGQNLTCTGGGEWSVDLSGDGYWHVWSGYNSKSILACYNNSLKVVMNGVLYVQEICAIDGNGMLMYNNSGSAYWTGGNTTNWGVGATNLAGFVRSNNNPVRHWRQGANYYFTESSSSSRLVKTNIVDMQEELAKNLLKLEVKSFDYREGYGLKGQFGMIAEDVEPLFPVVIDEVDSAVEPELPTIKMIDYPKFIPFLVKMIQIQQKEIDELKQQILKCD